MLFLLPNLLYSEAPVDRFFPPMLKEIVAAIDGLIAESPKEGRLFLKRMGRAPNEVPQSLLNEHTTPQELEALLISLKKGEKWGYVADAGLPCLADPGSQLVAKARENGIPIEALMGPSSILIALMLSGIPSQRFAFHGYLPQDLAKLKSTLKTLEKRSKEEQSTQLFIETPYRNNKLLKQLLEHLFSDTLLCVASHLTAPDQLVITQSVRRWKSSPLPNIDDKPTIFLVKSSSQKDQTASSTPSKGRFCEGAGFCNCLSIHRF